MNIRNARFADEPGAPEPGCDCHTCATYSAAYLHHLFKNDELLGYRLASIHNVRFLVRLAAQMGDHIERGTFAAFAREFLAGYRPVDETVRAEQKARWVAQAGFDEAEGELAAP
jgi:queuine tRNA-ribosyltransferase